MATATIAAVTKAAMFIRRTSPEPRSAPRAVVMSSAASARAARILIGNQTSAAVISTMVPMKRDGIPVTGARNEMTQMAMAIITNCKVRWP